MIFGKVVEGLSVLDKFESIEADNHNKPKEDIIIEDTLVMVNPYRDSIAEILMKEWK
jgi:cyclophilin family peptidyl-prolyl cis-trans isomerase